MDWKKNSIVFFTLLQLTACGKPTDIHNAATHNVPVETASTSSQKLLRQQPSITASSELSCMQRCGQEARGIIYTECLANGDDRQYCGTTGRQWYRNCLESKCDASAIQIDDCRTDCRIDAKEQHIQCLDEGKKQDCQAEKKTSIRTCIASCE